jgi:hypothetical protein
MDLTEVNLKSLRKIAQEYFDVKIPGQRKEEVALAIVNVMTLEALRTFYQKLTKLERQVLQEVVHSCSYSLEYTRIWAKYGTSFSLNGGIYRETISPEKTSPLVVLFGSQGRISDENSKAICGRSLHRSKRWPCPPMMSVSRRIMVRGRI